jgi:effector-binding domain-containing protein
VAEVVVQAHLAEAGNVAFKSLFGYISGRNRRKEKIAMTAPVSQEPGQKIAMTAPVSQQPAESGWAISFMMPSSFTMETLPEPEDPQVRLRDIPMRRMAAVRYSGRWTESGYIKQKERLETWIRNKGYTIVGEPVWARYNPPFTPAFLRRNEVLVPVAVPER